MDWSLPGSSVCGILQARILESVAMPSSCRSSQPGDQTRVSALISRFFTTEPPRTHCGFFMGFVKCHIERETAAKCQDHWNYGYPYLEVFIFFLYSFPFVFSFLFLSFLTVDIRWLVCFFLIFQNLFLFIWLHQGLIATQRIFSCRIWVLVPQPLLKTRPPALGMRSLSHWATREVLVWCF